MADNDTETHLDETRASGGSKEGVVRWVLVIGTLLAIVLLTIIWMTGALTQGDQEEEITATGNIEAQADDRGDGTDSVLGTGEDGLGTDLGDKQKMENGLEVIENDTAEPSPAAT